MPTPAAPPPKGVPFSAGRRRFVRRSLGRWWLALGLIAGAVASRAGAEEPAAVDFVTQVQPILAKRCLSCHGPDEQEGALRLDQRAAALAGGENGPVIVAGKPAESRLLEAVSGGGELVMPPEGEPLSAEEVALLRRWIEQGAAWPEDGAAEAAKRNHWSFRAPVLPPVPAVARAAWVRNSIDAFVLSRLEREGIEPSAEADRATLLRRLSLDLTGLPPTPDEVTAFLLDNRPDAYEQQVERLLASPHYGERMARWWLDLARYADSDGYEKDLARPHAWRYRNWVIEAFNRDLPFDRFTIEQLAGDLLPDGGLEARVATGFHRNTLTNREGGVDQEEFRTKAVVDRVNTTAAVWLGLTMGCCECHSHKYDPLAQTEYFGLYAFFNNADEAEVAAPTADDVAAYEAARQKYEAEHAPLLAAVAAYERDHLPARLAAWEASNPRLRAEWTVLVPSALESAAKAQLAVVDEGAVLVTGEAAARDVYTLTLDTELTGITALRIEALADERLPARGPGRAPHGNFVLSEVTLEAAPASDPSAKREVVLAGAMADHAQERWPAAGAIDGDKKTGWAIGPRFGEPHSLILETKEDAGAAGGTRLTLRLSQQYGQQHTLGKLRVSVSTSPRPVLSEPVADEAARILAIPAAERGEADRAALAALYRTIDPELRALDAAAVAHAERAPPYPATQAQVLAERGEPRVTHVHTRGDFLRPGVVVEPHTPSVLGAMPARGARPDRLDLARWIAAREHPLTARVTVNRLWQQHFGFGLVRTDDDFGTRGELPSHPELLDWLAREFADSGWSVKQLHRLLVGSATYRQSSRLRPELAERDPNNLLLARQNRFRVEAEIVRDLHLATSGLLNPAIGGPSVRPPLPPGVVELGYASSIKWQESDSADRYKRGMYIFFQRTVPYPMLTTFDAPDSNSSCTRRERSNTPLQALTLLNDPVFFECAQGLGRRIAARPGSTVERAAWAMRACLGREPTGIELERLVQLHDEVLAYLGQHADEATALAGGAQNSSAPAELAAWVIVGRTIQNLDEFVTRE